MNLANHLFNQDLVIPNHVAIIMDGNARWSKKNQKTLYSGHKAGVDNIKIIAEASIEIGVKFLTLYAFSSENWDRDKSEVDNLIKLLDEYLNNNIKPLHENGVKIIVFGDLSRLSKSMKNKIELIQNQTRNNDKLTLSVAFSYGSRYEIVQAAKKIAFDFANDKIDINKLDEDLFAKYLLNSDIPDPDLLIRTAGDLRISNFLLWQIAYTELCFVKEFWPEFSKKNFFECIIEFNKRERRYGKR